MRAILSLFLLAIIVPILVGKRILFLTPLGSKSHKIFFMGITEALVQRGHHVTMVSAYEPSKEIQNVREVVITNYKFDDALLTSVFDNDDTTATKELILKFPKMCSGTLAQQHVQDLKEEKFDLIIMSMFFNHCYLSFVHHFKVPFVYASSMGLFGPFSEMMNNVEFPSIAPNKLLQANFPLTFKERMLSTLIHTFLASVNNLYIFPRSETICKEEGLCPQDMPPLHDIRNNASLAIINSVRALEWPPRPMMPNIIYAGGAHIKPLKKLEQELEDWVEASGDEGFIFFSLGSALRPSFLPEKYRKILITVFGSLKQRVLWKWDKESMPDLPKNVKLGKWFPQRDILGHPKLRLFITHGGLLSTQESTYNGIPILGMPIFVDQFSNTKEAEKEGWGRVMQWKDLEENTFRKLIVDTINDKSLRELSKRRSTLMRDTPLPPDQEAAFWVEYVMRHKGAPRMMSPVRNMRWYEVYNIDVWTVITAIFLGTFYLVCCFLKFLLRTCWGFYKAKFAKAKQH